jgi:predicted esterase
MPHEEYLEFQVHAFQLYGNKQYPEALEYIQEHAARFPQHRAQTYNWRMCVLALIGERQQAVDLLAEALDQGVWWSEPVLTEDEDLVDLQELDEFQRLVARSEAMHQQANMHSPHTPLAFPPEEPEQGPYPVLLAMHGRNSFAAFEAPFWQSVNRQGWFLGMPRASELIDSEHACWDDTPAAVQEVHRQYQQLLRSYPLDPDRLVLGGFSQGAGMAIRMSLSGALPAEQWIAVAPWLPDAEELATKLPSSTQPQLARGSVILGEDDPLTEQFPTIAKLLDSRGVEYEVERVPGLEHMYPDDFDQTLLRVLLKV